MGLFNKLKRAFLGEEEEKEVKKEEQVEACNNTAEEEGKEEVSAKKEAEEERSTEDVASDNKEEAQEVADAEEEKVDEKEVEEKVEEEVATPQEEEFVEDVVEACNNTAEEKEAITPQEEEKPQEEVVEDVASDETETSSDTVANDSEAEEAEEETVEDEKYDKGLEKTRKTFGERLNELFANFRHVDEEFFEELEDTLITSDVGFETAMQLSDELRQEVKLKNAKKSKDLQKVIIEKLVDLYEASGENKDETLHFNQDGLTVILFVGVNGAGKTTTVGKLAHQLKQEGRHVLLAAADTFRAGAINQLVEWGNRADVEVVCGQEGGDPASVVFDAMNKAKEEQADVLLVDTAGRLQNKVNLMNELAKIKRVIQRELPEAPQEVLLVLDGTTGQNAMSQAKQFNDTTEVTGLVLTKLDGTAKGGIVLAIRNELNIPVKLVGLGEKIDDLASFDAEKYAYGLFKGLWSE